MKMEMKALEDITREEFQAYEDVRESAILNMFDSRVCKLAGFNKATHVGIIHYYSALKKRFPGVRKGT